MDAFILHALAAGLGIALITGPLGCIVVWRRMAFFGAAISHAALLGSVIALWMDLPSTVSILAFCLTFALLLTLLERQGRLATDTLLGILAHGALAAGLIGIALMPPMGFDLMAYLFGDVLAVTREDLYLIYGLAALLLGTLIRIWRPLISATSQEELAFVEGVPTTRVRLIFTLMLACAIAIGMKVVGILLIVSLLIIPAAGARFLAKTPEQMAGIAALLGVLSVCGGLGASLAWNLPAGPAIVAASVVLFGGLSLLPDWG